MRKRDARPAASARRARGEALDLACSRLLHLARELGPNARMPGLRALQAEIGVSQGTLNDALSRLEQRRVLVRRERSGVFVASRLGQRNVSLICSPDFLLQGDISPFWELLFDQVRTLAQEHDTHLTVGFSHAFADEDAMRALTDPSPLPDYLRTEITSGSVQGVIAVGLPHPTARWIEAQGVPVVAFAGAARYIVAPSRSALIAQGVAALAAAGCRRVDLWLPPMWHWHDYQATASETFQQAIRRGGLPAGRVVASFAPEETGAVSRQVSAIETGWNLIARYFGPDADPKARPDGIVSVGDIFTLGMLMALPHYGLTLGRDLQIATYANAGSPILLGWQEALYRVEFNLSELVEMLFHTLDALMDYGPAAASGEYAPPFQYDEPEYPSLTEKYRLVHPRLIPPVLC